MSGKTITNQRTFQYESVMTNLQMKNDSDLQNRTSNFELFSSSECIALLTTNGIEAIAVVTLNALAIIVFLKERRLCKRSMYLTISLTIADMFNAWPVIIWSFSLGNECNIWTINYVSDPVQITGALLAFSLAVSVTNLAAISLERAHATFRPFTHRLMKKKVFGAAVASACLTSVLFTAIGLLRNQFNFISFTAKLKSGVFSFFLLSAPFFILVSYTTIAIKFYCGTHPQHHGAISRERKLTKTLFIVTFVSLTLLLPSLIVNSLGYISSWEIFETISYKTMWLLQYSLTFLLFANSFINPLLYAFKIPEFKRALLFLLCCRFRSEPLQVLPLNDM
ncbi:lysophosphatidic acid receptor 3-like [Montipora capricornis]|uniref:lysophosphatidic acid receptor 3-like n=1 Tax=Montipora capricornis TaxID=246305 RepID=UPI0035F1373D